MRSGVGKVQETAARFGIVQTLIAESKVPELECGVVGGPEHLGKWYGTWPWSRRLSEMACRQLLGGTLIPWKKRGLYCDLAEERIWLVLEKEREDVV